MKTGIDTHLGKSSEYKSTYDPSLLVREPRSNNREYLGLNGPTLPFVGTDVWNAWEVSTLNSAGMPYAGIAKVIYPADSKYIVESKSLKLYLNSFNMTKQAHLDSSAVQETIRRTIIGDLSRLLETQVGVWMWPASLMCTGSIKIFALYNTLELDSRVTTGIEFKEYQEAPDLLTSVPTHDNAVVQQRFHSSLLKSNCRVTHQPDWGDVYIHYQGKHLIDRQGLLQYLISFRGENHFHEEITECIYTRLFNKFAPTSLMVCCQYLRRGGIDINVIRATSTDLIPQVYSRPAEPYCKTVRQ